MADPGSSSSTSTTQVYVYYPYKPGTAGSSAGTWGEPILVDADGDPIQCPPAYTTQKDPVTGKPVVILLSGDEGKLATVTDDAGKTIPLTPPTYSPPTDQQIYVYYPEVIHTEGSGEPFYEWGDPVLVDADGNPIKCPPAYTTEINPITGQPVVVLLSGDEGKVATVTDDDGKTIPLTPPTYVDVASWEVPAQPNLYVYWPLSSPGPGTGAPQWGDPIVVHADGNPVQPPPPIRIGIGEDGKPDAYVFRPGDNLAFTLIDYTPPTTGVYVYYPYSASLSPGASVGQWGEPILVDANGDPIKYPPYFTTETDPVTGKPVVILLSTDKGEVVTVTDAEGKTTPLTPPTYAAPADQQVYVYYPYSASMSAGASAGQWGEPILVDANGDPVKCPPAYTTQIDPTTGKPIVVLLEGDQGKLATVTGDDGKTTLVTPPTYTPAAGQEIYVYYPYSASMSAGASAGQWGEPVLVDANGDPIKCPPAYTTQIDPATGKPVVILLSGDEGKYTGTTPPTYVPPGTPPPSEAPEEEALPGDVVEAETLPIADEAEEGPPGAPPLELIEAEDIGYEPIPLPEPVEVIGIAGLTAEQISTLPAPTLEPSEGAAAIGDMTSGELVGAIPIDLPIPRPEAEAAEGVAVEAVGDLPTPAPEPLREAGVAGLGAQRIASSPVPQPVPEPVEVAGAVGLPVEEVTTRPMPALEPVGVAEVVGPAAERVADMPGPLPEPTFEVDEAAGRVAFGDGAAGEIPDSVSGEPTAAYRTEAMAVGPLSEPVEEAGIAPLAARGVADLSAPSPVTFPAEALVPLSTGDDNTIIPPLPPPDAESPWHPEDEDVQA